MKHEWMNEWMVDRCDINDGLIVMISCVTGSSILTPTNCSSVTNSYECFDLCTWDYSYEYVNGSYTMGHCRFKNCTERSILYDCQANSSCTHIGSEDRNDFSCFEIGMQDIWFWHVAVCFMMSKL